MLVYWRVGCLPQKKIPRLQPLDFWEGFLLIGFREEFLLETHHQKTIQPFPRPLPKFNSEFAPEKLSRLQ